MAPWPPGAGTAFCLRVSADPQRLPQPYLGLSASARGWEVISTLGFNSVFSAVAT